MTAVGRDGEALVAHLHARYVRCIDDDRLELWPDLFADPCTYKITTRENVSRNLPIGLMECTSRAMLRDRIEALRRVNIYEPHTYCHQISGLEISVREDGVVDARSNFLVVRTMVTGEMALFATGVYVDVIEIEAGRARFRERVAITDSRSVDTLLVIPL